MYLFCILRQADNKKVSTDSCPSLIDSIELPISEQITEVSIPGAKYFSKDLLHPIVRKLFAYLREVAVRKSMLDMPVPGSF